MISWFLSSSSKTQQITETYPNQHARIIEYGICLNFAVGTALARAGVSSDVCQGI